jgi:hypothetical protein
MLLKNTYAGYDYQRLIELKEDKDIDYYTNTKDVKIMGDKDKEYVKFLIYLCGWLTKNAKKEASYKEWLITKDGVNIIPQAIVFDDKYNKIVMDVELFKGILLEGIVSNQVKEIKKAIINIKQFLKNNKLNDIITIKPAINYWDDSDTIPIKRGEFSDCDVPGDYFSKKVPAMRITIDKSKLTDEIIGLLLLIGDSNIMFDRVNRTLNDLACDICKVRYRK